MSKIKVGYRVACHFSFSPRETVFIPCHMIVAGYYGFTLDARVSIHLVRLDECIMFENCRHFSIFQCALFLRQTS